jgi:hypothetical protein
LADCGWTSLAFLLFALTIALALPQLGPLADAPATRREPRLRHRLEPPQPTRREPGAQLDHDSETAPAQQRKPAPKAAPRDAPLRVSPKPQTLRDERTRGPVSIQDHSDAADPNPADEPADEESNNHPDKEQKAKKHEEEDQGKAPEKADPGDPNCPTD